MPTKLDCAAVLFDSDGVLVDSQAVIDRVLGEWAVDRDLDPTHVIKLSRGRRDIDLIRLVAPSLDAEAEARQLELRELSELDGIRAVRGARELVNQLPADRWAVVTSGSGGLVRTRLAAAGLPEPRVLISADDVSKGKPSPEGYIKAARALNAEPADCVVFEDSPSGIAAGRAAGARVVAMLTTAPQDDLPADLWIHDFRDVGVGRPQGHRDRSAQRRIVVIELRHTIPPQT